MIYMKSIVIFTIKIYQKLFSFDHSFWAKPEVIRMCRFEPSCSQYTVEAIEKYGVIKGSGKGIWRILRCNPLSQGGYDPVT